MDGPSAIRLPTREEGESELPGCGSTTVSSVFVTKCGSGRDNVKSVNDTTVEMAIGANECSIKNNRFFNGTAFSNPDIASDDGTFHRTVYHEAALANHGIIHVRSDQTGYGFNRRIGQNRPFDIP